MGVDHHDVLVVLGSGQSEAAELLAADADPLPLDTLPFFPPYRAGGHRAQAWSVAIGEHRVLVFGGRCHLYEGRTPAEVAHPVRTGVAAGCTTVILTATVGGIRDDLAPGTIMVVEDHLNLTGRSPLEGPEFVDMVGAYAPRLRTAALSAASSADPALPLDPHPGVYAQLPGPQFETPAEIRMLRNLGADVVGMSMALETIAARAGGADVLGLALVTNPAATESTPVGLDDVVATARAATPAVADVVRQVVGSCS
jgi:purine-nucleoside phosphorylase